MSSKDGIIIKVRLFPQAIRAVSHFDKLYFPDVAEADPNPERIATLILFAVLANPELVSQALDEIRSMSIAGIEFYQRMEEVIGSCPEYQGEGPK